MVESVRITLAPVTKMMMPLAIGTVIALLIITAIGTILGLTVWPAILIVYRSANRALGAATFAVNAITAVLAYLFVSWLSIVGERTDTVQALTPVLRRNTEYLMIARVATIVVLFETTFGFLRQEASNLMVVEVGNTTQLNFLSVT